MSQLIKATVGAAIGIGVIKATHQISKSIYKPKDCKKEKKK